MSENAESKEPFKLAVGAGRQVTLREAVESIVVLSANDSAVAIAEQLGGSEQAFAKAMTDKARQLGMTNTVFRNPSGLPDPEQVTSARDMATLGISLMRDFPEEFKLFSMRGFQFRGMLEVDRCIEHRKKPVHQDDHENRLHHRSRHMPGKSRRNSS